MPQRLFADDPAAEAAWREGGNALRQGAWGAALDCLLPLLKRRLFRRRPLTIGDRRLIERVAGLAIPSGRTEGPDALLQGLAEDNRKAGFLYAADYLTLQRVDLAVADGRSHRALELLQSLEGRIGPLGDIPWEAEQLPGWEDRIHWPDEHAPPPDRPVFLSRLYLQLGNWLAAEGHYGHAAVLLERGIVVAQSPASALACQAANPLRLSLAAVFVEQGRLAECRTILAPLAGTFSVTAEPAWRVMWLELSGQLDLLEGNFGSALERFAEVAALCAERGFRRATVKALLNQAEILILVNQISVADELLADARQLAQEIGDPHAEQSVEWLLQLADARTRSLAAGLSAAPSVTEIWGTPRPGRTPAGPSESSSAAPPTSAPVELPRPANYLAFFELRALGVQQALAAGDTVYAEQRLETMQLTFGDVESFRIQVRLRVLEGMVAYAAGDYVAAADWFDGVLPQLEEIGMQAELWQVIRFRGWCAARLQAPADEQDVWTRRAQELMTAMAGSLSPAQRAIYLLNKWTVEEKHLAAELEQLRRLKEEAESSIGPLRLWRRWQVGKRLYQFLRRVDENRRLLAGRHLETRPAAESPTRSLLGWLFRHRPDTAVVSFLVLPDRVLVAVSHRSGLHFAICPWTRIELRTLVQQWHTAARRWDEWDVQELDASAAQLASSLQLSDVLALLPRRVTRLTVVADDALHGFPFAALRCRDRYLVEHYALTMAYDRTEQVVAGRPRVEEALAIGVSRGAAGTQPGFDPLPGAAAETHRVAEHWARQGLSVRVLADDQAGRDAVLAALPRAGLAHVACHGTFEPDRAAASGLLLVPRPETVELVSLRDVAQLDLEELRHATLSSCWGADNFVLPGRWVISLPEAFCRSGAGSVLACLWKIADEQFGERFAMAFYEHLRRLPRDEALRQTQLAFIQDRSHPCCWAGYRLHGDGSRIEFARPKAPAKEDGSHV